MMESLSDKATLDDLHDRLRRYHRVPALTPDGEFGVPSSLFDALIAHWCDDFDWAAQARRIAAYPWGQTEQASVPVRAIISRAAVSPTAVSQTTVSQTATSQTHASQTATSQTDASRTDADADVVLLLHGWPDSVLRFERLFPHLDDVTYVAPALPGFPFAAPVAPDGVPSGLSAVAMADAMAAAMREFGFERYVISAGDVGCDVAEALAARHPEVVTALHLTDVSQFHFLVDPPADLDEEERAYIARGHRWQAAEGGYMHEQSTRPNTLAVGLGDSPAGLAAWIVEKLDRWIDGPFTDVFSYDEALTWVSAYWLTDSIGTSFTPYATGGTMDWPRIEIPTVFTIFAHDLVNAPRQFAERYFDVAAWREYDHGGHFAAWERPDEYLWGLRTALDAQRPT